MNGTVFRHPCLKILIFLLRYSAQKNKIVIFISKLCLQTAKRVFINQRTVYEYVIILFNQDFFEDQVYDWGRFQKTGSHTRTKNNLKIPPLLIEINS